MSHLFWPRLLATFSKNGLAQAVGIGVTLQVVNIVALLLSTAILSQEMGVAHFGAYVLIISVLTLLSVATVFGFPAFLTREIAASLTKKGDSSVDHGPAWLSGYALLTSAIFFGMAVLLVSAIQAIFPKAIFTSFSWFAFSLVLGRSFLEISAGALAGLGLIRKSQVASLFLLNGPFVLFLIADTMFLQREMTVDRALWLQATSTWLGSAVGLGWLWRGLRSYELELSANISSWLRCLRLCAPLALANGLASLQQNVVFLILGGLLSSVEVGIFRIAERLSALTHFLRSALLNILQPQISRSWKMGALPDLAQRLQELSLLNVLFNIGLLLTYSAIGLLLIEKMFGAEALAAWLPLLVLSAGYSIASVFGFNGMLLAMTSNAGLLTKILAIGFAILSLLILVLTQVFGIMGAALATSTYTILIAFGLWRFAIGRSGVDAAIFPIFIR